MADFIKPYWLEYSDVETIFNRMLGFQQEVNPEVDYSEGSFFWDMTRNTAIEISRIIQFNMGEMAKNVFPQFSYAPMVDYHAEDRMLYRRNAIQAFGAVTIKGEPGIVIERGTVVHTIGQTEADSIAFETIERATIPDEGEITIEIRALEPGSKGNVSANTITAFQTELMGITSVNNNHACSGGADRETDEELRDRIQLYDRRVNQSYVGTEYDYQLWALEVPGVGSARVQGCLDRDGDGGDGIVYITLLDTNGEPANERLIRQVYEHIMSPDDPENKKAAVNSRLVVEAPVERELEVTADLVIDRTLEFSTTVADLSDEFLKRVNAHIRENIDSGTVLRRELGAILIDIFGVFDYENLMINGKRENVTYGMNEVPVCTKVTFKEIR